MSCTKHFLGFRWQRHDWERQVASTSHLTVPLTDQWGRAINHDYVLCHARYVCRDCGAVRDGEECGCDQEHADHCAVRLTYLAEQRTRAQMSA